VETSRAVTSAPTGPAFLSLEICPMPHKRRWVHPRKAAVVRACCMGLIPRSDQKANYGVGGMNLVEGCALFRIMGNRLRATALPKV